MPSNDLRKVDAEQDGYEAVKTLAINGHVVVSIELGEELTTIMQNLRVETTTVRVSPECVSIIVE